LCCCEKEKKDAAQGSFAAGWVVPLLDGVDVASDASRADGEGGNAEGERQIGVGGTEALLGGEREVAVYSAEGGEKSRVIGERCGGAVADGLDVKRRWLRSGAFRSDGVFEDAADLAGGGVEMLCTGGAKLDECSCGGGDGVDGGSARDVSDVERGDGSAGERKVGDVGQGPAEKKDGIGRAGIGP